ncbi:phosphotransferase [Ruania suaedae]|uniref:phosphotransferase enzyme family protein n=1 Tax=Ruania suaedae TaxID=2897774 RepID=UPI001E2FDD07|nr:phosphotransferase [Ruania suaedae]UFU04515.1 phosphotransferase [Ruania suaedae]
MNHPPVTMLWEQVDPARTLTERAGFTDAAAAVHWLTSTVSAHWDLPVDSCDRLVLSDRNVLAWLSTTRGRMLAKWSVAPERFARLSALADLVRWLHQSGLPVSAPLPARSGALQIEVDGVSIALQRVIESPMLDAGDPRQVHAAGAVLARLHLALAEHPGRERVIGPSQPHDAAGMTAWLGAAGAHLPSAAVRNLRDRLADAPGLDAPVQLLHGDYRSANILCSGAEVAAVLDFEELRRDRCVDELARSAVLLGTRFHDWGPVPTGTHAHLLAGYETVRRLTASERVWWDLLRLHYTLVFVPHGDDPAGWAGSALDLSRHS